MFRVYILSVVLILGSGLMAYPQSQSQTASPPEVEARPPLSVPKDYKYNPRGRRDPFVNPVPKPVEKPAAAAAPAPTVRPPGLRGVVLSEAVIDGVVTSKDPSMTVVIIAAPGGNRYFARVGDALFDAVVGEISIDTVKFTLTAPGDPKAKTSREIVRPVRPTSGENK